MTRSDGSGGLLGADLGQQTNKELVAPIYDRANQLPVGSYEKSDEFIVVVNKRSGDAFLIRQELPDDVDTEFSVSAPPTENQVTAL